MLWMEEEMGRWEQICVPQVLSSEHCVVVMPVSSYLYINAPMAMSTRGSVRMTQFSRLIFIRLFFSLSRFHVQDTRFSLAGTHIHTNMRLPRLFERRRSISFHIVSFYLVFFFRRLVRLSSLSPLPSLSSYSNIYVIRRFCLFINKNANPHTFTA